jgi:hypothetical protein
LLFSSRRYFTQDSLAEEKIRSLARQFERDRMLEITVRSLIMRKLFFLPLLLLLAACGAATSPAATPAPESAGADAATATRSLEPVEAGGASQSGMMPVTTGATAEEARIVREQDHTLGASDPVVSIIEYGDFQ